MGEGIGNEEALMPFITAANIACGYHAGDEATMQEVIALCIKHQVKIGAHPSFPDRENFGRTAMTLPLAEVYTLVTDQLKILNEHIIRSGAVMHHVKPHGALYTMAAKNKALATTIARAVKDFDSSLVFYGQSGSQMIQMAKAEGLQTAAEVFADRTYQHDGSLTPRSHPNALLVDTGDVVRQVMKFVTEQKVTAITGQELVVLADTVCIHGDGEHAVAFAKTIYTHLYEK